MSRKTAVVVFSYDRPEYTSARLEELKHVDGDLIVSIDGPKQSANLDRFLDLEDKFSQSAKFLWMQKNNGTARHIFNRITELFTEFENVIVVEDDIEVECNTINALIKILDVRLPSDVMTIGLFSAMPGNCKIAKNFNHWRKSKFFSPWGWAIQKEDWELIKLDVSEELIRLDTSLTWHSLGKTAQSIWLSRFEKVIEYPDFTFDYQMFFWHIVFNKKQMLPIFRLGDNIGFDSILSTRTKEKKPRWYLGKRGTISGKLEKGIMSNYKCNTLFEFLDSTFWAESNNFFTFIRRFRSVLQKFQIYSAPR